MASTYKTFLNDDVVTTRTLLHEAIPITGSIVYGTYGVDPNEEHVKKFTHGMFQSVYDYPYVSSSANHIFDIAYGHHADILTNTIFENNGYDNSHDFYKKRTNIYNQMAQVLMGHDSSGNIQKFDADGDLIAGGTKYNSVIFFNFARLLNKDEIKKGSFEMQLGVTQDYANATTGEGTTKGDAQAMHTNLLTIKDDGAATNYRVNSPAGEYGILKITSETGLSPMPDPLLDCGLIFYQAGVVVLTTDVFVAAGGSTGEEDPFNPIVYLNGTGLLQIAGSSEIFQTGVDEDFYTIDGAVISNNISNDQLLNNIRKRIVKLCFNNTTELNSTIYFCRVSHNDFNYSSNPTYLNNSKIRVKTKQDEAPVSYITSVGLYSSDNELLAVAKLSEPLRKDPTNDMTLRVRLDY